MGILGLRDSNNFATDQKPGNYREAIQMLYPNGKAPLTGLTSKMKSSSTDDPQFNWWEKSLDAQRVALAVDLEAADTSATLASGAKGLRKGMVLYAEDSGEIMLVNADPVDDTHVSVTRGFAGTTPTLVDFDAAGKNPYITVIGSAFEEASEAPTGISFDPSKVYNYTQIFRNTLEASRTAIKTRLRTGDQVKEARRETLEYHSIEMERAFIFGKRNEGTLNGKPHRTTGGVISFIDSNNIETVTGDTKMSDLELSMYKIFKFGSSEKIAFCGNRALLAINQAVRKNSQYNIQGGTKEFGMNVQRLICPFGELVLITHPLFNLMASGTTAATVYRGVETWLLVLDQTNLMYRYFSGDDTRYEAKLEQNGLDGMKSGYISECGVEVHHPKTHYLIKGLYNGVVDS